MSITMQVKDRIRIVEYFALDIRLVLNAERIVKKNTGGA